MAEQRNKPAVRFGTEGNEVYVETRTEKSWGTEVAAMYMPPGAAREFAARLVAMADTIDGATTKVTVQKKHQPADDRGEG